jgi:DNA-binding transcriptional ArsR family regulator
MLKPQLSQAYTCISGVPEGRIERPMSAEDVLKALAEPRRQQILRLVRAGPRSVGEIAAGVDVTQQAVSQHLQVLKDAGLVAVRQDGTRRLYVIRPEGLESMDQFLAELWPAGLRRLKTAVEDDAP